MEIKIFQLIVLIFSAVIHEASHGLMAYKLGDPTAKLAGRLSLNPLKHIEVFGTIFIPLFLFLMNSPVIFGWAKPVPYNPLLLIKDLRYGPLKVALAGPFSNVLVALIFGLILRFFHPIFNESMIFLLGIVVFVNLILAVFNLIPIPPLDGSKLLDLFFPQYSLFLEQIGFLGLFFVFIFLMFFSSIIFKISTFLFYLITGFNF